MIIDWTKNCENIHRTKQLTVEDASDRKIKFRQEIVYIQYMLRVLHMTPLDCYMNWKQISNGTAKVFEGDIEEMASQFYRLYRKAVKKKYTNITLGEYVKPIKIYAEEVKYLNDMNIPLWVKQFWFSMLFYYKFKVQDTPKVQFSLSARNWGMRQCRGIVDKTYARKSANIFNYTPKNKPAPLKFNLGVRCSTFVPTFLKTEGEVVGEYSCISDIDTAIHLITGKRYDHKNEKLCPVCGKYFLASSKSKTDLCPDCYKNKERERIRMAVAKYRQK